MGIAKNPSRVSLPRIDKPYPSILEFLTQRFPIVGQKVWEERIATGKVLDDSGRPITRETPYVPQKRIFYFREVAEEPLIPLQEKVVFENEEILVACKPPFLPVTPAGPYVNECLLNRLRRKTCISNLVPLHRIDRETSGLVLFSKNEKTRGLYGGLFLNGTIEKTYEALSEVSTCTEKNEWSVENRLVDDDIWFRSKVVPGAINARSRIKRVGYRANKGHFLLYPHTGKKHQLRVHMSGLGFRILHDRYYPNLLDKQEDDLSKPLQLIARRVKFTDPISGGIMEFESDRRLLL
ncbi:MAG: pseudouridine synthase [Deltaproteobacteria bacterium]|nr:MAG: pseudouridine synthase [Deltaproteobacteria bacterium]